MIAKRVSGVRQPIAVVGISSVPSPIAEGALNWSVVAKKISRLQAAAVCMVTPS